MLPLDTAGLFHRIELILESVDVGTATISDVLDARGERNHVLSPSIRPLIGPIERTVHGSAATVQWDLVRKGPAITAPGPSTWTEVRDFIVPGIDDGSKHVYVAGSGPLMKSAAMLGGLSTTYLLETLRFEAIVAGGAIRDRRVVASSRSPVVGTGFVPVDSQGAFRASAENGFCIVDGIIVRSGDWVFIDGDGTVTVPRAIVLDVLEQCAAIEQTEEQILRRVSAGERLPDLIDCIGRI